MVRPKAKGEARKWRAERLKQKRNDKKRTWDLSETISSRPPSKPRQGPGRWAGAMRNACYVERRCLALLMSADAMGAMIDPGPTVLGCDRQINLAARGKASIQWRSGVASGEYAGRTTRGCGRGVSGRCRRMVCNKGRVACRRGDSVTWSKLLDSKAKANPYLTPVVDIEKDEREGIEPYLWEV